MGKRFDKMFAKVKEYDPELTDEQARREAQDWIEEEDEENASLNASIDEAMYGIAGRPCPEDTLGIESCDTWGTGEGQFHGRI
jgi:hypothetical protein